MVSFDMDIQSHNEVNYLNNGDSNSNYKKLSIKDYASMNNRIISYEERIVKNDNFIEELNVYNNITSPRASVPDKDKSSESHKLKEEYNASFTSFLPKLTSIVPPSFNSPFFGETMPQIPTIHPETHKTLHYLLKNCGVQKVADVPCTYLAQTCEEANVLADILKQFKEIRVLGFDTETTVFRNHMKGAVSLIQIAPTEDICLLFQVYRMCAYPARGSSSKNNTNQSLDTDGNKENSYNFSNSNPNKNDFFFDDDYTKYNNFFSSSTMSASRDQDYDDENDMNEKIWDINQFPYHLKDILTKKSIVKVGVNALGDADLLKKWYHFEMKGIIDLQLIAHAMKLPVESLSSLSYLYTGQLLEKDGGIKKMKFDKRVMKLEDIIYSARDAVMGLAIFNRMVRPPVTFPDKLPVQRRKYTKKKNRKMKLSDSLYQNNLYRMKKYSNSSQSSNTTTTTSNTTFLPPNVSPLTPINNPLTNSSKVGLSPIITNNASSSLKNSHSFIDDNTVISTTPEVSPIEKTTTGVEDFTQSNLQKFSVEQNPNNNRRIERKNNPSSAKFSLKIKTNKNKNIEELNYNQFLKQKLKQLVKKHKNSPESVSKVEDMEGQGHVNPNGIVGNGMIHPLFTNGITDSSFNEDYVDFREEMKKTLSPGVKISAIISSKKKVVNDLADHLKKIYPANSVVNSEKIVSIMKNSFGYNTHLMVEQRKKRYIYEMVRRLIDSGKFIVNFDNDVVVKSLSKKKKNKNSKKNNIEEITRDNNHNTIDNDKKNTTTNTNTIENNDNGNIDSDLKTICNDKKENKLVDDNLRNENANQEIDSIINESKSVIVKNGEKKRSSTLLDAIEIDIQNNKTNSHSKNEIINNTEMVVLDESDKKNINVGSDEIEEKMSLNASSIEEGQLTDNEEDKRTFELQQQQEKQKEEIERQKRMEYQNKLMDLIEVSITEDDNYESSHVPLRLIALTIPDTSNKDSYRSLSEFSDPTTELNEESKKLLVNKENPLYDEPEGREGDLEYDSDNLSYCTDNSANDYENDYFEEDIISENYDNYYSDFDNITSDNVSIYSYMESPNNSYSSDSDSEGEYHISPNRPLHINQFTVHHHGHSDLKNFKSTKVNDQTESHIKNKRSKPFISSSLHMRNDVYEDNDNEDEDDITHHDSSDPGLIDPKSPTAFSNNTSHPFTTTTLKVGSNNESDVDSSSANIVSKILSKKNKKNIKYYEDLYEKEFQTSHHSLNENKNNGYKSDSFFNHPVKSTPENKNHENKNNCLTSSPLSLNAFSPQYLADFDDGKQSNTDDDDGDDDTKHYTSIKKKEKEENNSQNSPVTSNSKRNRKRKNSIKQHKAVKRAKTQSLSIYDSL
ncbi:hypothetical protein PIROE2DRAFT_59112 [Piromyces sp. E2]|nr:hypothetical protein PIROE2DRAFT_59112 [Piromyces sp. E2]|eukprot:OUM66853.1 hypothetical protein PIROE2DRAFT_59112 [Piromyces sp. E2]